MPAPGVTLLLKGSCLCGAVTFQIDERGIVLFNLCHCKRCQKRSGTTHTAQLQVVGDCFQWTQGAAGIAKYQPPNSVVAGTFCSSCGSRLPSAEDWTKLVAVPAGLLDDEFDHVPEINIHAASVAKWHAVDESMKTINGQGSSEFWTDYMQRKRGKK